MKNLIATVILWTGLFMSHAIAQNNSGDTLNIFSQEELFIKIASPNIHKLKHSADIYELISEFKTNLSSVVDQIPKYDIFTISYVKSQSLKVEEVQGTVKYQVENNQMVKAHNQNIVHLIAPDLQVTFYINEMEDFQTRNYESMIKSAFAKVKRGSKLRQKINSPINEFFYSYSKGEMVDGYERVKFKNRFGIVVGATVGFFKSKPIYEVSTGIGYNFGVKNNNMLYLYLGQLYRYDESLERPEVANLLGIGLKTGKTGSFSLALVNTETFNTKSSLTKFDDVKFRVTGTAYPTKGISISAHFYFGNFFDDDILDAFPSVSFGFGF